jgi:peptidyl-tRNA hydrolase, PTH1 family
VGLLDRLRGRAKEDIVPGDRWLVVGLGNPEAEYGGTRHNIGADVVRRLADRLGAGFKPHKAQAQIADAFDRPGGNRLSLIVPFGYMNNSGGPVQSAMAFYSADHERLMVVHDDLDLELGQLKLKLGGGDGGHNGLKDIRKRTGSGDYIRVRIGIGRPPGRQDPASYVLKKFGTKDREEVDVAVERACDAILDVVDGGLEAAQNRHH